AGENDWRLSRCTGTASTASTGRTTTTRSSARSTRCARTGRTSSCAPTARCGAKTASASSSGAANIQASDIALAHGSVPGGLDLTGFCVGCDAVVDAVVDEDVGIGDTADRAVLVSDHRGLIGRAASIIVAPLTLHRREIHRLCVDEFHALGGVVGADPEAGIQQVR